MAGTISFGGLGSGIDVNTVVNGLVTASQGPLNAMKAQQSGLNAAKSSLSQIGSLLGKLQTALEAVDETKEVGSYAATSSQSAVVASASGLANPGSYQVSVDHLAAAQRSYSDGQTSQSDALGLSGSLDISVAGGAVTSIALDSSDSLDTIASKINGSGLRVSASIFNDGTKSYLQVAGLDTGAANTIAFSGTTLGLDKTANRRQDALDSQITIDNFTITRPTNQVQGAIPGVTLTLTAPTTTPATVKIATDPQGLANKLNSVVSAYNSVIDAVHTTAGYGSATASVSALSGDALLRSLTTRMSDAVGTVVGSGTYQTLGSLGVSIDRDGHMALDSDKLNTALQKDPNAVAAVIAGPTANTGAADVLRDVVKAFNAAGTGLLSSRQTSLASRLGSLSDRMNSEQDRLDAYAEALRKQFTALDKVMSQNQLNSSYLTSYFK
jgi:flagellar hook-associated protein 2